MTKSLRRKGFVIHELESLWEYGTCEILDISF